MAHRAALPHAQLKVSVRVNPLRNVKKSDVTIALTGRLPT